MLRPAALLAPVSLAALALAAACDDYPTGTPSSYAVDVPEAAGIPLAAIVGDTIHLASTVLSASADAPVNCRSEQPSVALTPGDTTDIVALSEGTVAIWCSQTYYAADPIEGGPLVVDGTSSFLFRLVVHPRPEEEPAPLQTGG